MKISKNSNFFFKKYIKHLKNLWGSRLETLCAPGPWLWNKDDYIAQLGMDILYVPYSLENA